MIAGELLGDGDRGHRGQCGELGAGISVTKVDSVWRFLFPHRPGLRWIPIRGCNMAADSAASQNSLRSQTLARRMENENDVAI
jgi:hypothetical protein